MKKSHITLLTLSFITISGTIGYLLTTLEEDIPKIEINEGLYHYESLREITIDSCEYILYNGGGGVGGITHKANCKNH